MWSHFLLKLQCAAANKTISLSVSYVIELSLALCYTFCTWQFAVSLFVIFLAQNLSYCCLNVFISPPPEASKIPQRMHIFIIYQFVFVFLMRSSPYVHIGLFCKHRHSSTNWPSLRSFLAHSSSWQTQAVYSAVPRWGMSMSTSAPQVTRASTQP